MHLYLSPFTAFAFVGMLSGAATQRTVIGRGECGAGNGRVDHCCDYGGPIWIRTIERCQQLCAGMETCRTFEFGRQSHYSCCVYPEQNNGNFRSDEAGQNALALKAGRTWYCYMHGSDGPVDRAQNHGHAGVCYRMSAPTTASPTTGAPTTAEPTFALPTTIPTPEPSANPTPEPTFAPSRHACNDGSHGCDATAHGICQQLPGGRYRCSCAPTHHCSDLNCAANAHTCVLNTVPPTRSPTAVPTTTPTASPTVAPTAAPSAVPTAAPSTLYTYDFFGNPIFPLDAQGNEMLATDQWGQQQVPVDNWGRQVYPPAYEPSAAPSALPSATPSATPSAAPSAGASSSSGSSSGETVSDGAVTAVVVIAAVLLVVVIAGAVLYVKGQLQQDSGGQPQKSFSNPTYDSTPSGGAGYDSAAPPSLTDGFGDGFGDASGTSGYMDVPAAAPGAGYMDVNPIDDSEDV